MKKWASFAVKSPTEIVHEASHPMLHHRAYRLSLPDKPPPHQPSIACI